MSALVLALAGTDHHPFDRLVQWVDEVAARHPSVRFVVQHGTSAPPEVAEGHAFLPYDDMVSLIEEAVLVVCHGGPGTVMDARELGHVPWCLPRDPDLGEHVDDHQQRFAAMAATAGILQVLPSPSVLEQEVVRALVLGPRRRASLISAEREAARGRVAAELDMLVVPRQRRRARAGRVVATSMDA